MMDKKGEDVYIGIGSNLGDPIENCLRGIDYIASKDGVTLLKASSFYRTEPVGIEEQPWFINAVIQVKTLISPEIFLGIIQEIETSMGRKRKIRWAPRVIDLDILIFGELIIERDDLIVPHPLLHERRFVLEPLYEIAPNLIHPSLGVPIKALLEGLKDDKKVLRIDIERPAIQL
jgi:2-amino-4-hydroxy-6-hydroxymethyldihydropteridine diphosphokinase